MIQVGQRADTPYELPIRPVPSAGRRYCETHGTAREGALIASLIIGGLLLAAMAAAAGYAAVRLPGDARVPLHAGTPEYSVWLPKRAGLAAWLGAGAAAFAALAWLCLSRVAANWATSMRVTLLPAVMCVALSAEVAAIILARRATSGDAPGTPADATPLEHE